ncbi:MAG: class I SAM-dependent methyltransferase [Chthoniobacterales bacterium]
MSQEMQNLQTFLDRELFCRPSVRLLEAGCGSAVNLNFGRQVRLVGIDISEKQLARNTVLHEKIAGDIQRYEFPPDSFDAIVCWEVLEHLLQPELALRQFAHAIKPGGLVILRLPNVLSLKGLVTKFLPYTFHVLAYRYFYGDKNVGKNDTVPFKTYLRFCISAGAIRKQGAQLGLQTVYFATADVADSHWLQRKTATHFFYVTLKKILSLLSLGRIGDSELIIVLKK